MEAARYNRKREAGSMLLRNDLHTGSWHAAFCFTLFLVVGACRTTPAEAGTVHIPHDAAAVRKAITAQCPDCMTRGVFACGTAEVRFGGQFIRYFFLGKPMRGYLPEFTMSGREFETLTRTRPLEELVLTVRESFAHTRLIIVENGFTEARVIDAPVSVEVDIPPALHQCLQDQAKPWGCCLADRCENECCEKQHGSPTVQLQWFDTKTAERLIFNFSHTDGISTIKRVHADGSNSLYWCISGEAGKVH